MLNTAKIIPSLALLPLAACASSSDGIATTAQALEAECSADAAALPEDAWICPEPLTVECDAEQGAVVETLYVLPEIDGPLTECGAPLAVSDEGPFGLGEHLVEVSVEGDAGLPSPVCSAELTVVDTLPPELVELPATELWPPNHRMHRVTAEDCFEVHDCDPDVSLRIVEASSDEPFNGRGDGNHEPDIVFDGCDAVQLRAERQGGGDGRVYTLTVEATDEDGHVAEGTCHVVVPHDQSGRVPVDSGPVETVALDDDGC